MGLPAVLALLATLTLSSAPSAVQGQERDNGYRNLQVLPADIERAELGRIMLANLRGLGLPRRANEGCLYCHVGSMDVPAREWDWASDEKSAKRTARTMMAMVLAINDAFLSEIDRSSDQEVGCYSCHAGRTNPRTLEDVLLGTYADDGVDAVVERYRELRRRYFAADAYDFRTPTLASVADSIAQRGAFEDAARVHRLNIEFGEDPEARSGLIRMRMFEALSVGGVEAMLARYREAKREHPPEAFGPGLLDALGWRLFRSGRRDEGFLLFELNREEHPGRYTPVESLAWASRAMGRRERALALAEAWVRDHPGHELGLRLLSDMRGGE